MDVILDGEGGSNSSVAGPRTTRPPWRVTALRRSGLTFEVDEVPPGKLQLTTWKAEDMEI